MNLDRWTVATLIAFVLSGVSFSQTAEPELGSVCVAPLDSKLSRVAAPELFCESEKFSFQIDSQPAASFQRDSAKDGKHRVGKSLKVDGLDTTTRHKVVIYCDGKPHQSFAFRFSDFKTRQLCLFISDFYKTAQLWEAKGSPWCKCK
jgi:hypothetical protein